MLSFKRPLSVVISLLMLFTLCVAALAEGEEPVVFSVSAPESVQPGETFAVAVEIGGGDYTAHSLFFTVKYNSAVFSLASIAPGPIWNSLPMDSMKIPNTTVEGEVTVGILCPTSSFTGHGTLMYINLKANELCTDGVDISISVKDFFLSEIGEEAYYWEYEAVGCSVAVHSVQQGVLGDLDGDGQVTFLDITVLSLFLSGEGNIPEEFLPNADYNCDGAPTYVDLTDMYLFIIG